MEIHQNQTLQELLCKWLTKPWMIKLFLFFELYLTQIYTTVNLMYQYKNKQTIEMCLTLLGIREM